MNTNRSVIAAQLLAMLFSSAAIAQGQLTNGGNDDGAISVAGETDTWTFSANSGDQIILRIGELTDDNGQFDPQIQLFSPTSSLLGTNAGAQAAEVTAMATSTGTFTVVVSDGNVGSSGTNDTGSYRLHLVKMPGAFVVHGGDEGGDLINGATHEGTITVGDLDMWSFTANAGESIIVRAGETLDNGGFDPWLRLYGPNGALLPSATVAGAVAAEVTGVAASTGTYTVVVGDGNVGSTGIDDAGRYRLTLAKGAGTIVVSQGDEGGDLINGATLEGTIAAGDLDVWSFKANAGESIIVRAGEVLDNGGFDPWLRLYGPNGALLPSATNAGALAAEVTGVAASTGTYTVVVADGNVGSTGIDDTGTYRLHLAKVPSPFVVGDEGGVLVAPGGYFGIIHVGDLDTWSFCAAAGDTIVVRMDQYTDDTGGFDPWVRLYGPGGALVSNGSQAGAVSAQVTAVAAGTGTYTGVVADANVGSTGIDDSGSYVLGISGTLGCPFICIAPPAGLVSWWTGDGTSADAQDGNVGLLRNGATFGQGKIGQGFSLDGADDFVSIADSGNLNLVTSLTWDAWIEPYWLAGDPVIMSKEASSSSRTVMQLRSNGSLCGYFDDFINPGSMTCSPGGVVPVGQFTHVAMVLDGAADEMRLYVNGLRVATGSQVGYPAGNTAGLVLGMSPSEGHFFGGVIDDVDVFSRALSDQEISAIFNSGTAGKCGCPSQLSCDDGNVCTIDGCLASTGECTHTNSDYPCDDANSCTTGDTCSAGACVGGPALPCDDFNACTTDSCDPSFGCFYQDNTPLCDDGSACTLDTCDPGTGLCAHQVIPIEEVPTLDFLDYLILQWPQTPDASSWNTYRGTIPARYLGSRPPGSVYDHVCLESGDEHGDGPTISLDPSSPPLGTAYYYDITGENACGEGPLGMDSSGIVRPNARPCP